MRVVGKNIHPPKLPGDVGYDLGLSRSVTIWSRECVFVPTGVRLELPEGVWAEIVGRSTEGNSLLAF